MMSASTQNSSPGWVLRADSGLSLGTIYPLNRERILLGRSVDVNVPVDDGRVSRVHAAIESHHERLWLVDLGSTNGTFLNGIRVVKSMSLKLGDEIRLGSTVYRLESLDQARHGAHKVWKEATRSMRREDVIHPAPAAKKSLPTKPASFEAVVNMGAKQSKISTLSNLGLRSIERVAASMWEDQNSLFRAHARTILLGLSALLILAAAFVRFR